MKHKQFDRDILKCHFDESWSSWPSDRNKGVESPISQKPLDENCELIDLPGLDQFDFDTKLQDAVKNRCSHREFTHNFLSLKELAFLLWSTQGVLDKDISYHRTVPSASARHPFETYLAVRRVRELSVGIYRYLPLEHKLAVVFKNEENVEEISKSCFEINATQMETAAVSFIWTAVPYRSEWSLGPYAYKLIALDAGHICQNLYLAVEAIGCGTCAIAAYSQEDIDRIIGVNGKDEFAIYMAPVGKII